MSPLVPPVTYAAQVKGTHVSLDDFANTPALATTLNNAVVSGLLIVGPGHNGDHGSPALSDEDKKYQFPEREGRGRERTRISPLVKSRISWLGLLSNLTLDNKFLMIRVLSLGTCFVF